jgi:hypothetical protein
MCDERDDDHGDHLQPSSPLKAVSRLLGVGPGREAKGRPGPRARGALWDEADQVEAKTKTHGAPPTRLSRLSAQNIASARCSEDQHLPADVPQEPDHRLQVAPVHP